MSGIRSTSVVWCLNPDLCRSHEDAPRCLQTPFRVSSGSIRLSGLTGQREAALRASGECAHPYLASTAIRSAIRHRSTVTPDLHQGSFSLARDTWLRCLTLHSMSDTEVAQSGQPASWMMISGLRPSYRFPSCRRIALRRLRIALAAYLSPIPGVVPRSTPSKRERHPERYVQMGVAEPD